MDRLHLDLGADLEALGRAVSALCSWRMLAPMQIQVDPDDETGWLDVCDPLTHGYLRHVIECAGYCVDVTHMRSPGCGSWYCVRVCTSEYEEVCEFEDVENLGIGLAMALLYVERFAQ